MLVLAFIFLRFDVYFPSSVYELSPDSQLNSVHCIWSGTKNTVVNIQENVCVYVCSYLWQLILVNAIQLKMFLCESTDIQK